MLDKWQSQWNRWGVLTSQIALIAILFLYGWRDYATPTLIAFLITIVLAQVHHHWIRLTLDPLIDRATNRGNFKNLARLAWIHQDYVVVGSVLLGAVTALSLWLIDAISLVPYSVAVIALAGVNASWRTTLRFQATPIVLQAVAIRRLGFILGAIVLFFLDPDATQGEGLFWIVIMALTLSMLRLLVGHLQRYKEHRYRRQFEDSGEKESYLTLAIQLFRAYVKTATVLILPIVISLTIALVYRVVYSSLAIEGFSLSAVLVFAGVLFAKTQVASLIPATHDWPSAYQTQNMSHVRDQLALIIERMVFRSAVAGVVIVSILMALQSLDPGWLLAVVFILVLLVMIPLQVYLLEQQVAYMTRPRARFLIDGIAGVVLVTNTTLLSIYYPAYALLIGFALMLWWLHVATIRAWIDSIAFEWGIHGKQVLKVLSGFFLSISANVLILWVVTQVPLGVDPSIEGIVLAVIFVMMTSVIVYSMNAVFGLRSSTRSLRVFIQESLSALLAYEEEVSLW